MSKNNKFNIFLEDYGKIITIIFIIGLAMFAGSIFFKTSQKKDEVNPINNTQAITPLVKTPTRNLNSDLGYAGFSIKETNFDTKILESTKDKDKIEIFNDKLEIYVTTLTTIANVENTGYSPDVTEMTQEINPVAKFMDFKGKSFGLSSPVIDNIEKTRTYTLLDLATAKEYNVYNLATDILAPNNMEKADISNTTINIVVKFANVNDLDTDLLNQAKNIILSIDRVDKKEIFIDSSKSDNVPDENKYRQSNLLKYKMYVPDSYVLSDDPDLDKSYVSNGKNSLTILKKQNETESFKDSQSNLVAVSSKIYRPASISEVKDGKLNMQLYGNMGKDITVELYPDTDYITLEYSFDINQPVENIKKAVLDLDLVAQSIANNQPPRLSCKNLQNQSIPFGSPFCDPNWMQIEKVFTTDHKAVDLLPNDSYYKQNTDYMKNQKQYFYATCDGQVRNYKDRVGGANVVELQCSDKNYKVEYWRDDQSFWTYQRDVKAGDVIGIMGETGQGETGKHLHYVIIKNDIKIDPLQLIKSN